MKNIFTTILAIAALLYVPFTSSAQEKKQAVQQVNLRVTNLHCGHDISAIKGELLKKEGVLEVTNSEFRSGSSVFTVKFHKDITDRSKLTKTIESTPGCEDKTQTPYRVANDRSKRQDNK